jgi:hypothetical protein
LQERRRLIARALRGHRLPPDAAGRYVFLGFERHSGVPLAEALAQLLTAPHDRG